MSEPAPEVVTTEEPAAEEAPAPTAEDIARLTAALDKERELRKGREKELSEFRSQAKASMTEAERAAAEAEERGAARVRAEYGQRLVKTQFAAEIAKRDPDRNVDELLEFIDLGRFVGEDGEPDAKAIAKATAAWVPERTPADRTSVDVGQGPRSTPSTPSFSQIIRQAAGRA